MTLLLFGLFIGLVLGVVGTKMFGSKIEAAVANVEASVEAEKKEFQELEAKYGDKLKAVYNNLSGDLKQVIERYHYLKSKFNL